jgi:DNA-directed RNA polymerase subunit K/omega
MSEVEIPQVDPVVDAETFDAPTDETPIIHPKAPVIESRFLYVDVAALRAKQLRRGARPRLDQADEPIPPAKIIKAERVAMEEVKQNLVQWDLPEFKAVVDLR